MVNLKEKWAGVSSNRKKYLLWAVILIGLILMLMWLLPEDKTPRIRSNERVISSVLTDADTTGVSQNAIASRLRAQDGTLEKIQSQIDAISTSIKNFDQMNKRLGDLETKQKTLEFHQGKDASKATTSGGSSSMPYSTSTRSRNVYPNQNGTNGNQNHPRATPNDVNLQEVYENTDIPPSIEVNKDDKDKGGKNAPVGLQIVTEQEKIEEQPESGPEEDPSFQTYLPATSIMSGVFISGMDAPTSQEARKDPYPALIRIKKDAILPNRFKADIRECGLLAAGFGELSSERAYFRSEVITCIRDDGAVFESKIDSYAVGEDGKAGVRGRLVTKQGQYLAKALTAGFLQAASQLFSVQSIPTINVNRSSDTSDSPYQQVMSSSALQGAAVAGVGGALERLADFYMKMAGDLFPVIEIDPGRSVDFIVQQGVKLNFTRVKPNGSAMKTTFNGGSK